LRAAGIRVGDEIPGGDRLGGNELQVEVCRLYR